VANSFFGKGVAAFANAGVNYASDTIKAALLTTTYTPNLSTDQFYSVAVAGGAITAAGVALGTKTTALGVLGAANLTWTSVSGSQSAYVCVYKDGSAGTTDYLILLYDTASGLPVTPNGGNITAAWNSGNLATLCQGLDEHSRTVVERLRDRLRKILGMDTEWDRGKYGLWVPAPRMIQA
jgi:hypothetical protein